jgi:transposase
MTAAHPSDPTAPSYADLLAQNAQLQQETQQLQQQIEKQSQQYQQLQQQLEQRYQQQMDAQRQQYEAKLACINQALTDAIAKQQRLIHRLFGQKSEGLTPKQTHLNKETALEDLALLEQAHDNFLANLSDDERAKLPASKPIDTQEKGTQPETPTKLKRP